MAADPSVGVISIATNGYSKYWKALIISADKNLPSDAEVNFHLFTDEVNECSEFSLRFPNRKFSFYEIESLGWPEATLHRYRIYSEYRESLVEDVLMHLDSDMLVEQNFLNEIFSRSLTSGMGLVLHPGYFRPKGLMKWSYYLSDKGAILRDLRMSLKTGGLGAWENREESQAYVARRRRKRYFCGGIWFGERKSFLSLVKKLESQERIDSAMGITALWHDESHLNKWATENQFSIFSPALCYEKSYLNLVGINNIITAVNKNLDEE